MKRWTIVLVGLVVVAGAALFVYLGGDSGGGAGPAAGSGGPVAGADHPMVVAAGDIAKCDAGGDDEATAKLLEGIDGTILTLGDNAYPDGTGSDFEECYEPSWGRFKDRTRPVPGNHEYDTPDAAGYFGYFGEAAGEEGKGYYSFDLGSWHIIALNSECDHVGGCSRRSPQGLWLQEDLAANEDKACTLAFFHRPRFNSGEKGNDEEVEPFWEILHDAGADVVLSAHDHNYQRFTPQDPEGNLDTERGIRQFVVGTGGGGLYEIQDTIENTEVYNDETYGVLRLELEPDGYGWEFLPAEDGAFTDSGGDRCH